MTKSMKRWYKKLTGYIEVFSLKHRGSRENKFSDQEWLYYGGRSIQEQLLQSRKRFERTLKLFAFAAILGMAAWGIGSGTGPSLEDQLLRPEYGGLPRHIQVNAEAEYRGAQVEGEMDLSILSKELNSSQENERLELCEKLLETDILQGNESLARVSGDLNLMTYHEFSGVWVSWFSTDIARINLKGQVNLIGIKKFEKVMLQATLSIGKSQKECLYSVVLIPSDPADYASSLQQSLLLLQETLNKNSGGSRLRLPSETPEGIQLSWSVPKKSAPVFFVPLALFLIAIVYFSRYDRLIRTSKRKREAIEEEIPNLALQLILLLNAGLVASAAFEEILHQNKDNAHPLYAILDTLSMQSAQSNISFIRAFYAFSQTTGNRNLLRFATMVADHETRGSELVNKLERERDQLWESRLQRAKAKAREADTKLCMPLMLLLLVLVAISVSPALMEM